MEQGLLPIRRWRFGVGLAHLPRQKGNSSRCSFLYEYASNRGTLPR